MQRLSSVSDAVAQAEKLSTLISIPLVFEVFMHSYMIVGGPLSDCVD
jgi:hypothetical protein